MTVGTASRREILSGIFNYANQRSDWGLKLIGNETELTAEDLNSLLRDHPDGLILSRITNPAIVSRIADSGTPTIILETDSPVTPKPVGAVRFLDITKASICLGRFAAQYLMKNGSFRQFAFVPSLKRSPWSLLREKGFCSEIKKAGKTVSVFREEAQPENGSNARLADWLKALPKPAAVMAAHDIRAVEIIEACTIADIAIPETVNVLSVDNDGLLCENANPPISSIKPAHQELGYAIARKLDALMRNRQGDAGNVVNPAAPLQVVERRSTRMPVPAARLVEQALRYIEENAVRGISAQDVVNHLGVSRPLAYLRFKELHAESIGAAIRRVRLAAARDLLRHTQQPLETIARKTGFADRHTLARLLKRSTGKTSAALRRPGANPTSVST